MKKDKFKTAGIVLAVVFGAYVLCGIGAIIFLFINFFFIPVSYKGPHPELFTEAVYSIDVRGYGAEGQDPEIYIIESDEEGRLLFTYSEDSFNSGFYLLILQKSDEEYAYYYTDLNFIATDSPVYSNNPQETATASFTQEQIEELKELNDWDKPFDESKCIKTTITRR